MHAIPLHPYDGDRPFDPKTVNPLGKRSCAEMAKLIADFKECSDAEFVRGHSDCRIRLGSIERYFASYDLQLWLQRWRASLLLDSASSPVTGATSGGTRDTPS